LQVVGFVAQSENAPVPFVPDFAKSSLLFVPPPLLLHAVSASAIAATPATSTFPLWALTCE
jgi:hypothetical protein